MKLTPSTAPAGAVARPRTGMALLRLALAAVIVVLTPNMWGQDNATINGTVGDTSGALVANATIDLTNIATAQTRETTSNTVGQYRFGNVGYGTYTLTATATGFQKFTKTDIVINVAQTLEENIGLAVGNQSQTVTVEADALQVQTETSEVSTLISGQQVSQLATNGRNIVQLAALGAGWRITCLRSAGSMRLRLPTASASTGNARPTTST